VDEAGEVAAESDEFSLGDLLDKVRSHLHHVYPLSNPTMCIPCLTPLAGQACG
jgi:hypothetical protein